MWFWIAAILHAQEVPSLPTTWSETALCANGRPLQWEDMCKEAERVRQGKVSLSEQVSFGTDRRAKLRHLYTKFMEIKNTEAYLHRCCGNETPCRVRFQQTKMTTTRGRSQFDAGTSRGKLMLSEKDIEEAVSSEDLDVILLHGMGHACQHAQVDAEQWSLPSYNSEDWELTGRGFRFRFINGEVESCVQEVFRKAVKSKRQNFSRNWAKEVFSDAIFLGENRSVSGLAMNCQARQSDYHLDAKDYMHCFLKLPELRNSICRSTTEDKKSRAAR